MGGRPHSPKGRLSLFFTVEPGSEPTVRSAVEKINPLASKTEPALLFRMESIRVVPRSSAAMRARLRSQTPVQRLHFGIRECSIIRLKPAALFFRRAEQDCGVSGAQALFSQRGDDTSPTFANVRQMWATSNS